MDNLTLLDKIERDLPEIKQTDVIKLLRWLHYEPSDYCNPNPAAIPMQLLFYYLPKRLIDYLEEGYPKPPLDPGDWE